MDYKVTDKHAVKRHATCQLNILAAAKIL